jgi:type II secretory pathway pseudopilin PulG
MHSSAARRNFNGFTVLEICSALVIIMILVTLLIPAYAQVRARMDKVSCMNNLRQLYVGANSYVQEYGNWPQVNPALLSSTSNPYNSYYEAWVQDFMPFGVGRGTWICPTTERDLGGPDYTQPANYRTDYIAMPFDINHLTPYRWPTYPWFVERGNVHGNGNLMIQSNGAIIELPVLASTSGS